MALLLSVPDPGRNLPTLPQINNATAPQGSDTEHVCQQRFPACEGLLETLFGIGFFQPILW
jgi:hypothetical protein